MAVRHAHSAPSTHSAPAPASTPAAALSFAELGVPDPLTTVLAAGGITAPFPIQTATLPDALAGRDVLGRGRTGSGKTYAFALPMLARLAASEAPRRPGRPRALVLAPTRELASQLAASITPLAEALSLRTQIVFGGVSPGPQISALRAGVDILVACPGRLADHVRSGRAHLDAVEITVLDEADHMADLGFLPTVRQLLDQTPRSGQRMLFSATLDGDVDVLVRRYLTNPVTHSVDPPRSPVTAMSHHVLHVTRDDRLPVLVDLAAAPGRTLVFTRTKRGAKTLARRLVAAGVPAAELHGDLTQPARDRNLLAFSGGSATTLVATDIAARGLHVDDVTLVVHFDPPVEHKAYLHRSGRTARAGAAGTVVTLMTDDQVGDVRTLARKAGIAPTTTRAKPGHPLLGQLAPGQRTFVAPAEPAAAADPTRPGRSRPRRPAKAGTAAAPARSARSAGTGAANGSGSASGSGQAGRAAATGQSGNAASFSARTRARPRRGRR